MQYVVYVSVDLYEEILSQKEKINRNKNGRNAQSRVHTHTPSQIDVKQPFERYEWEKYTRVPEIFDRLHHFSCPISHCILLLLLLLLLCLRFDFYLLAYSASHVSGILWFVLDSDSIYGMLFSLLFGFSNTYILSLNLLFYVIYNVASFWVVLCYVCDVLKFPPVYISTIWLELFRIKFLIPWDVHEERKKNRLIAGASVSISVFLSLWCH